MWVLVESCVFYYVLFPVNTPIKKKKTRLSSVVYSGFFSLQGPSSLMTPCNISKLTEARLSSAVFHRARSRRLPPVHAAFQRLVQVLEPNSHFGLKGLFGGGGAFVALLLMRLLLLCTSWTCLHSCHIFTYPHSREKAIHVNRIKSNCLVGSECSSRSCKCAVCPLVPLLVHDA